MRDHDEDEDLWERLAQKLIRLLDLVIARLEIDLSHSTLTLTIEGAPMADYQLNQGDTVVVTIVDTDDVTGDVVTPDAGSVSVQLSPNASSSTVVLDESETFATITAGPTASVGDAINVSATFDGVDSTPAVGTFDVVAAVVPPPDATTLSVSFGTEAPAASVSPVDENPTAATATEAAGTFRNS